MMYRVIYSDDHIEHHGILGQKWGVRNGPPYPLSTEDRSSLEKKEAGKSEFHLTESQKKALKIGAAVVATGLVAYGAYKLSSSGVLHQKVLAGSFEASKVLPNDRSGTTLRDIALSKANPTHGDENCTAVVISAFCQEQGIPLSAKNIKSQDLIEVARSCFKDFKPGDIRESRGITSYFTSYESASKKLVEWYGSDASGAVSVPYKSIIKNKEFAHAFNFSIKDGIVEFYDGQPDPPIRNIVSGYFDRVDLSRHVSVVRLDRAKLNTNGALEFLEITTQE